MSETTLPTDAEWSRFSGYVRALSDRELTALTIVVGEELMKRGITEIPGVADIPGRDTE